MQLQFSEQVQANTRTRHPGKRRRKERRPWNARGEQLSKLLKSSKNQLGLFRQRQDIPLKNHTSNRCSLYCVINHKRLHLMAVYRTLDEQRFSRRKVNLRNDGRMATEIARTCTLACFSSSTPWILGTRITSMIGESGSSRPLISTLACSPCPWIGVNITSHTAHH